MAEDSELIMDMLREAREWAEINVGHLETVAWPQKRADPRIHLARLNAEIARRIPQQWCSTTPPWGGLVTGHWLNSSHWSGF